MGGNLGYYIIRAPLTVKVLFKTTISGQIRSVHRIVKQYVKKDCSRPFQEYDTFQEYDKITIFTESYFIVL